MDIKTGRKYKELCTIQAKRIKQLEEHLEEFGCHKTSCDYPLEPCNCGFEQALKEK